MSISRQVGDAYFFDLFYTVSSKPTGDMYQEKTMRGTQTPKIEKENKKQKVKAYLLICRGLSGRNRYTITAAEKHAWKKNMSEMRSCIMV